MHLDEPNFERAKVDAFPACLSAEGQRKQEEAVQAVVGPVTYLPSEGALIRRWESAEHAIERIAETL